MTRYRGVVVFLHWLVALLVIVSLVVGKLWLAPMPNAEPFKLTLLGGHMLSGILVLLLMIWRVAARWRGPDPAPANAGQPLLDFAARAAHAGLYLLIFGMSLTGIALSQSVGLPAIVFGGEGALPASFEQFQLKSVHEMLSGLLIALIVLHFAAAIWHQVVRKDDVMARMRFR